MMNRIVLVGRLTRDPELRKSANDVSVATFTIAVDDYSQKDANGQKSTTFLNVVVFRQSADNVQKFCRKGSLVGVDGKIRQRNFTKKDGSNGTVYEVVADSVQFLEPKGSRTTEDTGYTPDEAPAPKAESKKLDAIDVADDDFPF